MLQTESSSSQENSPPLKDCLLYPQKRTFVGISDFNEKEGF
jgi:hypothetical protein